MAEPAVPETISHYEVLEALGAGGMGAVYRARDRRDGSPVAIKVMHPHLIADETFRERFTREAHVAALLRSPYTVHLLDYGFAGDHVFLAMEFIEGDNLRTEIRRGVLTPERALRIAVQVSRALEEAEARGVVHRDIKPENILLATNDQVKVADFGIARQVESTGLTAVGGFIGTPAYAAPEQLRGEAGHRSDIYSLGAVLYECLVGRPPSASRSETLANPRYVALSPAVTMVLQRCLAEDPVDRFERATELTGALERVLVALREGGDETLVADLAPTQASVPVNPGPASAAGSAGEMATLNVRLGMDRRGTLGGRLGATTYMLSVDNPTNRELRVGLSAGDEDDVLSVDVPAALTLGPNASGSVPIRVRRKRLRWFGGRRSRRFTVTAAEDGRTPAAVVGGTYDDMPMGVLPIGGGLAAVVVAGALFAAFGLSGGSGGADPETPTAEASPAVDTELVEDLLSPQSLFPRVAASAGIAEADLLATWTNELTLAAALEEAGVDPDDTASQAVEDLLEAFEDEHGSDDEALLETLDEQSTAAVATFLQTLRTEFDGGSTPTPTTTTAAPTPTPAGAGPTATPTAPLRISQGDWTYNFQVVENTCGEGMPIGNTTDVTFSLSAAGSADTFIEPGEIVSVFETSSGTFLGDHAFTYPGWDISYAIGSGFFPSGTFYSGGTAFLSNFYFSETSGTSILEEVYQLDFGTCSIIFED